MAVDRQERLEHFAEFDLLKCNHHEAEEYLARSVALGSLPATEPDFKEVTAQLRESLNVGILLITRGADGLSLCSAGDYVHLPAANRSEVFDVTGAGDTVVAVATLALASGEKPRQAAMLANYAAGLVVRKLGVAAPTPDELAWAVNNW